MGLTKALYYSLLILLITGAAILYFYNTILMAFSLGIAFLIAFFRKQFYGALKALGL